MDNKAMLDFFEKKLAKSERSDRYWWFRINKQLPLFFNYFTESQKKTLCDWYDETDETGSGECNYPLIGMLVGLIGTNPRSQLKMVQLGHYNGFSSLFIGCIYKNIGVPRSLFSMDISEKITLQANKWVKKMELEDYVKQIVGDSADKKNLTAALDHFKSDNIDILFIDSSHAYEHTLKELNLWFDVVKKGGFIFLHDTSKKARQKSGVGVYDAFSEFCKDKEDKLVHININSFVDINTKKTDLLYQDGCGLGIIQKIC